MSRAIEEVVPRSSIARLVSRLRKSIEAEDAAIRRLRIEVDESLPGSFLRFLGSGNLFRLKGRLSVGRRIIARLVSRLRKSIEAEEAALRRLRIEVDKALLGSFPGSGVEVDSRCAKSLFFLLRFAR